MEQKNAKEDSNIIRKKQVKQTERD